jgi:hypothetical protein
VDALTAHAHDHDLRMKEFSKLLEGCAFSWYASLALGFVFGWNDLATRFIKKFFAVDDRVTLANLEREKQRLGEKLLDYIRRFRDISLSCHDAIEEVQLVDLCIAGMLYEYKPYLENLQIMSFAWLTEAARRSSRYVKKPSKGTIGGFSNATKQPWKREREGKKIEISVLEEPKKDYSNKKRER